MNWSTLAHADLAQGVMLERRHDDLTHVALVEGSGAGGERVLEVQVGEPHVDEVSERAGRGELALSDGLVGSLGEQLLELALGGLRGGGRRLNAAQLAVVAPEPGQRTCSPVARPVEVDLIEGGRSECGV